MLHAQWEWVMAMQFDGACPQVECLEFIPKLVDFPYQMENLLNLETLLELMDKLDLD